MLLQLQTYSLGMLHRGRQRRRTAQCSGPLAGHWCRYYIVVEPAHNLEAVKAVPLSSPATLLVVKDNIEAPIFLEGSGEVCECQVIAILQDLFQEEAMVYSVIHSRQINKDGSCHWSFLEPVFNVLCEIQKLTC